MFFLIYDNIERIIENNVELNSKQEELLHSIPGYTISAILALTVIVSAYAAGFAITDGMVTSAILFSISVFVAGYFLSVHEPMWLEESKVRRYSPEEMTNKEASLGSNIHFDAPGDWDVVGWSNNTEVGMGDKVCWQTENGESKVFRITDIDWVGFPNEMFLAKVCEEGYMTEDGIMELQESDKAPSEEPIEEEERNALVSD